MEHEDLTSNCTSGCESGWTVYLQHSRESPSPPEEDDPDGLSMLSDASSGPPQLPREDADRCGCNRSRPQPRGSSPARAVARGKRRKLEDDCFEDPLDDTASTSFCSGYCSKAEMDSVDAGSKPGSAHIKGRSTWTNYRFGFLALANAISQKRCREDVGKKNDG